jgi:hypothetical protein
MISRETDHAFNRNANGAAARSKRSSRTVWILLSNGPPVNGNTLSAGVYLGSERGLHLMQLFAQFRAAGSGQKPLWAGLLAV